MVSEVFAGVSAIKTAFDMAQSLFKIHDTVARDRAIVDLQKEILSAQAAQTSLIEQVSALKADIAKFEKWDGEEQKYELKDLGTGIFAYMLKPAERGTAPPHWVCANCFSDRKLKIIQHAGKANDGYLHNCPSCHAGIRPNPPPRWID